jgi:hypothetical protein
MRAPCTALSPNGPQPTIATVAAGGILASVPETVAPRPATATQLHAIPRSAADAFENTGTTHSSHVTINSASPPICEFS